VSQVPDLVSPQATFLTFYSGRVVVVGGRRNAVAKGLGGMATIEQSSSFSKSTAAYEVCKTFGHNTPGMAKSLGWFWLWRCAVWLLNPRASLRNWQCAVSRQKEEFSQTRKRTAWHNRLVANQSADRFEREVSVPLD
jgi:hypothetical protein